jgi:hypothetical protein
MTSSARRKSDFREANSQAFVAHRLKSWFFAWIMMSPIANVHVAIADPPSIQSSGPAVQFGKSAAFVCARPV